MQQKTWWLNSTLLSIVLIIVLVCLWKQMNTYYVEPTQLVNEQSVDEYLAENWENRPDAGASRSEPLVKIKTGLFIQSLKFFNSSEVNVTGYIWQRYQDGVNDQYKPEGTEVGFILPEQVNSGSDIDPRVAYRKRQGDEEVIGWYFEATLRQPFDYSRYPFDHKTVWLCIWPREFSKNVVLVPDFSAYKSTDLGDIFGIEEDIVLGAWVRHNTFFDYKLSSFDTNFGINDYIGQNGFPDLHYNFVIKRKFENAFIIYLLPLMLVATLLFAALLTVSGNEELTDRLGFNAAGFIGASSALFFVVLLAHIQLREQFGGAGIVYIEYFYILIYVLLVVATANTYLFSIRSSCFRGLILYQDNILFKVAYWPVVLICMNVITWLFL